MNHEKFPYLLAIIIAISFGHTFASMAGEKPILKFQPEGKTWEEILSILKPQDKPGLIFFTSLCGVAKSLEKNVFHDEKAIEYIQTNFICFRIDNDEREGKIFSDRFKVTGFPTVMLINKSGEVLNKVVGFSGNPAEYIKRLQNAINENRMQIKADYERNPEDWEKALKYADMLHHSDETEDAIEMYEKIIHKVTIDSLAAKMHSYLSHDYEYTFDTENAIKVLENGLQKDIFDDEKDVVLCRLGNLHCSFYRTEVQRDYREALRYYRMLPEKIEDFKTYNRSANDKNYISWIYTRAQQNMPAVYAKCGLKENGLKLMNMQIIKCYDKKDFRGISGIVNRCMDHEVFLEETMEWAEKADDLSEWKDARILGTYGSLLGRLGDFKRAIEIQKKVVEIVNTDQEKEYEKGKLAVLYCQAGEFEQGNKMFHELYSIAGENFDKICRLSYSCNEYNVYLDQSLYWTEKAIELSKEQKTLEESRILLFNPGMVYNVYAGLLFKAGRVKEAVQSENKAVELVIQEDSKKEYRYNLKKYMQELEQ